MANSIGTGTSEMRRIRGNRTRQGGREGEVSQVSELSGSSKDMSHQSDANRETDAPLGDRRKTSDGLSRGDQRERDSERGVKVWKEGSWCDLKVEWVKVSVELHGSQGFGFVVPSAREHTPPVPSQMQSGLNRGDQVAELRLRNGKWQLTLCSGPPPQTQGCCRLLHEWELLIGKIFIKDKTENTPFKHVMDDMNESGEPTLHVLRSSVEIANAARPGRPIRRDGTVLTREPSATRIETSITLSVAPLDVTLSNETFEQLKKFWPLSGVAPTALNEFDRGDGGDEDETFPLNTYIVTVMSPIVLRVRWASLPSASSPHSSQSSRVARLAHITTNEGSYDVTLRAIKGERGRSLSAVLGVMCCTWKNELFGALAEFPSPAKAFGNAALSFLQLQAAATPTPPVSAHHPPQSHVTKIVRASAAAAVASILPASSAFVLSGAFVNMFVIPLLVGFVAGVQGNVEPNYSPGGGWGSTSTGGEDDQGEGSEGIVGVNGHIGIGGGGGGDDVNSSLEDTTPVTCDTVGSAYIDQAQGDAGVGVDDEYDEEQHQGENEGQDDALALGDLSGDGPWVVASRGASVFHQPDNLREGVAEVWRESERVPQLVAAYGASLGSRAWGALSGSIEPTGQIDHPSGVETFTYVGGCFVRGVNALVRGAVSTIDPERRQRHLAQSRAPRVEVIHSLDRRAPRGAGEQDERSRQRRSGRWLRRDSHPRQTEVAERDVQ
eukprot:GHVN01004394.1.p1 GENE.GHVN01004394.1~~GHVN01004394.1.p1  ORF type:complete len:809 (-),score=263.09 GHVN01004394.1:1678-3843(-)